MREHDVPHKYTHSTGHFFVEPRQTTIDFSNNICFSHICTVENTANHLAAFLLVEHTSQSCCMDNDMTPSSGSVDISYLYKTAIWNAETQCFSDQQSHGIELPLSVPWASSQSWTFLPPSPFVSTNNLYPLTYTKVEISWILH